MNIELIPLLPEDKDITDLMRIHASPSVAIKDFYSAGGYDFFKVVRPEKYADKWLDFIGNPHQEFYNGKYISDGVLHDNPLDSEKRKSLKEQGVPDVFTGDTL